jgi:beta-N-acetylhexosaminidase
MRWQAMPLEVKIGQMILAGVQDETVGDDSRHIINELHIGNIILMGRNFDSPDQVLRLTQDLQELAMDANGVPLLIGTDQEGGLVQRANYYAGFTPMPPAELVGAAQDPPPGGRVRAHGWRGAACGRDQH